MEKTKETLIPVFATPEEITALGAAVIHWRSWLERTPEKQQEFEPIIALLDRFQQRLGEDYASQQL